MVETFLNPESIFRVLHELEVSKSSYTAAAQQLGVPLPPICTDGVSVQREAHLNTLRLRLVSETLRAAAIMHSGASALGESATSVYMFSLLTGAKLDRILGSSPGHKDDIVFPTLERVPVPASDYTHAPESTPESDGSDMLALARVVDQASGPALVPYQARFTGTPDIDEALSTAKTHTELNRGAFIQRFQDSLSKFMTWNAHRHEALASYHHALADHALAFIKFKTSMPTGSELQRAKTEYEQAQQQLAAGAITPEQYQPIKDQYDSLIQKAQNAWTTYSTAESHADLDHQPAPPITHTPGNGSGGASHPDDSGVKKDHAGEDKTGDKDHESSGEQDSGHQNSDQGQQGSQPSGGGQQPPGSQGQQGSGQGEPDKDKDDKDLADHHLGTHPFTPSGHDHGMSAAGGAAGGGSGAIPSTHAPNSAAGGADAKAPSTRQPSPLGPNGSTQPGMTGGGMGGAGAGGAKGSPDKTRQRMFIDNEALDFEEEGIHDTAIADTSVAAPNPTPTHAPHLRPRPGS